VFQVLRGLPLMANIFILLASLNYQL